MLRTLVISALLCSAAFPALAADPKQEAEKLAVTYTENVAKKDAAGVASLYSKDGVQINPGGVFSDITKLYEGNFKNGTERIDIRTGHVWVINNDTVLAEGETDIFGKNPSSGEATKVTVYWSATDIRENGQMKIRMLTVGLKPPPPKEAEASAK
jgi:ketosteroid isomerase-like protein